MKSLSTLVLFGCVLLTACNSSPWKTYRDADVGISVGYPREYSADTQQWEQSLNASGSVKISVPAVFIGDGQERGHNMKIFRTDDSRVLQYLQADKPFTADANVGGIRYRKFEFDTEDDMFGYVTERDDMYYVLLSNWGPYNQITDKILQSLTLE